MTQIQALDTRGQGNVIGRIIAFLYGIVSYVVFFVTFLYAIGFVEDLVVPKTIDGGTAAPTIASADRQSRTDVDVRHSAQRDGASTVQAMVDEICAAIGRTHHLRAARQPGAGAFDLAVATDVRGGVADRRSANRHGGDRPVIRRLADRADQYVPDQSFRAVRIASGGKQSDRPPHAGATLSHAAITTSSCGIRFISASSSRSGRRRR